MKTLEEVGAQRTREARGEPIRYFSLVPDDPQQALSNPSQLYREGYVYYVQVCPNPNAMGRFVFTSLGPQMAFFPFEQIETISPRPLLLIAGSEADTLYFSTNAYEKAKEPCDIRLDLLDARLELLAGFRAGRIGGFPQLGGLLLQGLNALSQRLRLANGHCSPELLSAVFDLAVYPRPGFHHRMSLPTSRLSSPY